MAVDPYSMTDTTMRYTTTLTKGEGEVSVDARSFLGAAQRLADFDHLWKGVGETGKSPEPFPFTIEREDGERQVWVMDIEPLVGHVRKKGDGRPETVYMNYDGISE